MDYHKTNPMLQRIVGRVHVSKSNRYAIKYVISRLKRKYATWKDLPRNVRKDVMRQVITIRNHDFVMYAAVMSGKL